MRRKGGCWLVYGTSRVLHPPEYHLKIRLKHDEIIKAKHTHIIKEDGGIAMAQLANLPSRLFHILFGQPPREGEKAQDRKQWIKKKKTMQRVLLAKTVTSESFTAIGKCFYGCQLKIKVASFISSTATQCQDNNSNRTRTQYSKNHFYAVHIWMFFQCSLMVKKLNILNNSALHVLLSYLIITTEWHLMNILKCAMFKA